MRYSICFFFALLVYAQLVFAQSAFDLSKVIPLKLQQRVIVCNSTGEVRSESIMTTDIKIDKAKGRLFHIRITSDGRYDSTVCDLSTLKPIYFITKGSSMDYRSEYKSTKVKSLAKFGDRVIKEGDFAASGDFYDNFMDTYLFSLLPLKPGYMGSFNIFRQDLGMTVPFEVKDVIEDYLKMGDQKYFPVHLSTIRSANVTMLIWTNRKTNELLKVMINLPGNNGAFIRETIPAKSGGETEEHFGQSYTVFNRSLISLQEDNRKFIRFSEGEGSGMAWLDAQTFSEGTIEVDIRGRDEFQKSFIGIAFHGVDNKSYEVVYFRPFNYNVEDKVRAVHAIQYCYLPKFDFDVLRQVRYDEFESGIGLENISRTDWFHAKIEIKNGRIKVFVNNQTKASMDVATLNPSAKNGKIGFWVGNNSNGDFAKLKIVK